MHCSEPPSNNAAYFPHPSNQLQGAMTATSMEQQKRLYSTQLAAHTIRQWNAVRRPLSSERKSRSPPSISEGDQHEAHDGAESNGQLTPTSRTSRQRGTSRQTAHGAVNPPKVHVVDFAARTDSAKPSNKSPTAGAARKPEHG
ncbi:hypothetical protein HYPSUDRAFT_36862 [Hypholoma sublateritium FD-334 SS-4]|uniref:Uncharacterized protein n=1 Tax=Hypholoma sublateritium (strain FD-334 SS-4) TaxID=945553 RepID=A0A0D2P508_HYPSF|nr:hypothetical protein HYPSUDRAFT_36862 [Hypholoma sublateritium FD-334 SS-4]